MCKYWVQQFVWMMIVVENVHIILVFYSYIYMCLWFTAWVCQHYRDGHQEVSPPEESSKGEKGTDAVLMCVLYVWDRWLYCNHLCLCLTVGVWGSGWHTDSESCTHTLYTAEQQGHQRGRRERGVCERWCEFDSQQPHSGY